VKKAASQKEPEASSGAVGFAFGLIVGALIGAAAAILMAPQPGELTREQLRMQAMKLRRDVRK
jgi:gas vesicle protein